MVRLIRRQRRGHSGRPALRFEERPSQPSVARVQTHSRSSTNKQVRHTPSTTPPLRRMCKWNSSILWGSNAQKSIDAHESFTDVSVGCRNPVDARHRRFHSSYDSATCETRRDSDRVVCTNTHQQPSGHPRVHRIRRQEGCLSGPDVGGQFGRKTIG